MIKHRPQRPAPDLTLFNLGPTLTKQLIFLQILDNMIWTQRVNRFSSGSKKKYKVQITVKKGRSADEPEDRMVSEDGPEPLLVF